MKNGIFANWKTLRSLEHNLLRNPSIEDLSCILQKCGRARDQGGALRMHAYILKHGLHSENSSGKSFVSLVADVGFIDEADQVFDRLDYPDGQSWVFLIRGYIRCGKLEHALSLYNQMKMDFVHSCEHTFMGLLKACTKLRNLSLGKRLHADVARRGFLDNNIYIGCAVVAMYSKCGSIKSAKEIFYSLPARNVVAWTALVTGYCEHGDCEEALWCLEQMKLEGILPNSITFVCTLKACSSISDISKGWKIHAEIVSQGLLLTDLVVGNALVDMYAKCGFPDVARMVFEKLPMRDVVSWTSLISGYAEHGNTQEALKYFQAMQHDGVVPDEYTFVCILKACGNVGAIIKGQEIHDDIERQGLLDRNIFLGSTLVDMYVRFGLLTKAQEVFDRLPVQHVAARNALLAGYVEHGQNEKALHCFKQMQSKGFLADAASYACCLKACGNIQAVERGQDIHAEVERQGLLEKEIVVGNALINMYAKCGAIVLAQEVFDRLLIRDILSWNAIIAGYMDHEFCEEAINCYELIRIEGTSPDSVSYVCILKACSRIGIHEGREIHAEIEKQGLIETDVVVGNSLVSMYGTHGLILEAQDLFYRLPIRNTISWNALIAGHVECGHNEEALQHIQRMKEEVVLPDIVTFVCCLNACGSIQDLEKGKRMYAEIEHHSWLEKDVMIGNSLVDMLAKCGSVSEAQKLFDRLHVRDVVSWNALIAGYAEHDFADEALNCLEQMQIEGILPNPVSLVCGLNACGHIGAFGRAQEIHARIERWGLLGTDLILSNSLVSLYSKCGWLDLAQQVFDKLPYKNIVSRTAMMVGYGQIGEYNTVFAIFDKMISEGIKPDRVTCIVILTACSHAGLLPKSETFFYSMSKEFGVLPTVEHHACMIDILGRVGHLDKAVEMIQNLPIFPNVVMWQMILASCRKWGNVKLGKEAFDQAVDSDEKNGIAHVTMTHMYA